MELGLHTDLKTENHFHVPISSSSSSLSNYSEPGMGRVREEEKEWYLQEG